MGAQPEVVIIEIILDALASKFAFAIKGRTELGHQGYRRRYTEVSVDFPFGRFHQNSLLYCIKTTVVGHIEAFFICDCVCL